MCVLFWVATCFRANTVSIIVDETTDITGRYMPNIVVSTLTSYEAGHPYLLALKSLEKTNHLTDTHI
jgi:hypothetical protein